MALGNWKHPCDYKTVALGVLMSKNAAVLCVHS
jgi:hypothetical protein